MLTDLREHGAEDILITATDKLNGFTDTILSFFIIQDPNLPSTSNTKRYALCGLEGQKSFHQKYETNL